MPVVMLNYPRLDTPIVRFLLNLLPSLDFTRNLLHLLAWEIVGAGWIAGWLRHCATTQLPETGRSS